jgi:thiol-disulfide isomerase/thioredoxin
MRLSQAAQLVFIVLASLAVYSFVRAAQSDHRITSCSAFCQLSPTYAARNRRAPDFELPDMQGRPVRLSSLLGSKPVVLNFWTKECEPCLREMPMLGEMAALLRRDGVRVVTICTDEGPDAVRDTLAVIFQGREPPFTVLFDPELNVVRDKYGTTLYPETWFLDKDGIIRARVDGPRDWSSAIALDVVEMLSRPSGCPVQFSRSRPAGPFASLCSES